MNPIEQRTLDILNRSSEIIRELPNSAEYLDEINKLARNVRETKCTLAVGGRVKAGKSTFINTLLGEQLALVGTTETTATINRFIYGKPADPSKPIKVVYKNGNVSYESQEFMDSFQGNDAKTMALSKGILYFERAIENPILLDIDLVDTPGTDAVVDEHQEVAESAFGIAQGELRKEHDEQTKDLVKKADAVIYLVGAVANQSNKQFLDNFQQACEGASALNAIGVISRIDEEENTLYNSKDQAEYVANSLKDQLSGVMPVSASLYYAINKHAAQFENWQRLLKAIPEDIFNTYLCRSQEAWEGKYDAALVKKHSNLIIAEVRRQMKGDMPWGVFRAIVKTLYSTTSAEEARKQLLALSNFDEVKQVLQDQFFARAKAIKCTILLAQLKKILWQIRNEALYRIKRAAKKSAEWMALVNNQIRPYNSDGADELLAFIQNNVKSESEIQRIEQSIMNDLVRPLEQLENEIKDLNTDYKMLQEVQRFKDRWGDLYAELCELFGMYGAKPQLSAEQKMQRQMFWQGKAMRLLDPKMQEIARYAASEYGKL
jgi:hypothetical protein